MSFCINHYTSAPEWVKGDFILKNVNRTINRNINITAGEELNKLLKDGKEEWIPFNEAMIKGDYSSPLFSKEFCIERSRIHGVSFEEYSEKLAPFLILIEELENYSSITLWFGDEPFCQANYETVIGFLKERHYEGDIILNIVSENDGTLLESRYY